ncbi:lytic transglycosylase domain-containing protein [Enterobacter kobei]|uniref:lytic transglycosylase domain-containing protein n=1 Tax=Enterobacter kobei TaxID=208224 RepID=UPI0020737D35|nr:lytic transglycosylase domain-containing protein [Enterobacter kobei]ELQ3772942.1 lytic transglycosylase domain-containing protein [Enterobacter kobei]
MLTTAALFQLAMQCAPAVHPDTIHDITRTESGLNPYAIAEIVPVKGGRSRVISHLPSSKDEALKIVEAIKQKKHRYSVGLMQITSTNFPQFGVSAESMFNPCDNMTAAAKIITDCYQRGGTLQRALSCYYSGNFETGQRPESAFGNTSYVQRIGYVVPSTRAEQQTASPSSGEAPAVPSDNTVYPDSVIRGVIPAPDTTPTSIAAYPPHVVRGGLAVSSD